MKISNFSKLMLIAAMALAGNTAYKMLQNRTQAAQAVSETCPDDNTTQCCNNEVDQTSESTVAALEESAPVQTAMYGDRSDDFGPHNDDSDNDDNDNDTDDHNEEDEDHDYATPGPDDVP